MTQPFDHLKALKVAKSKEKMLGYAGFELALDGSAREGFVKIASVFRPTGSGMLGLTFLVDTESAEQKAGLQRLFDHLDARHLSPYLGSNFEKMTRQFLGDSDKIRDWLILELSIHVRRLLGYEKTIVEKDVFPALSGCWPISFQPVEWWPQEKEDQMVQSMSARMDMGKKGTLKNILKRFLGS